MGKRNERVLKKNSLMPHAASHNDASWGTDRDEFLEHSPSRGSLYYKGPTLQKIIPVFRRFPFVCHCIYLIVKQPQSYSYLFSKKKKKGSEGFFVKQHVNSFHLVLPFVYRGSTPPWHTYVVYRASNIIVKIPL